MVSLEFNKVKDIIGANFELDLEKYFKLFK